MQASNANIALLCMETTLHRKHLPQSAAYAVRLTERRRAAAHTYFTPANADHLLHRIAPSLSAAASARSHASFTAAAEPAAPFIHANPIAYIDVGAGGA